MRQWVSFDDCLFQYWKDTRFVAMLMWQRLPSSSIVQLHIFVSRKADVSIPHNTSSCRSWLNHLKSKWWEPRYAWEYTACGWDLGSAGVFSFFLLDCLAAMCFVDILGMALKISHYWVMVFSMYWSFGPRASIDSNSVVFQLWLKRWPDSDICLWHACSSQILA